MTITLEQIEGMNLQFGDKIEIEIKIEDNEKSHNTIGYFIELEPNRCLKYSSIATKSSFYVQEAMLSEIEEIKILDYKK